MGIEEKLNKIDKMASKFFVTFFIVFLAFVSAWNCLGGYTIFSSLNQDISILFILINQGVIIGYLT
tara:strand:+ start:1371 stop:1568 length:198 start_codon:yes stop_codon:yes gene_type:complete